LHCELRLAVTAAEKPLVVVLQARWMREFAQRAHQRREPTLAFLDATGQTNRYGYMSYALLYKVL
jgi:hypothetical protein